MFSQNILLKMDYVSWNILSLHTGIYKMQWSTRKGMNHCIYQHNSFYDPLLWIPGIYFFETMMQCLSCEVFLFVNCILIWQLDWFNMSQHTWKRYNRKAFQIEMFCSPLDTISIMSCDTQNNLLNLFDIRIYVLSHLGYFWGVYNIQTCGSTENIYVTKSKGINAWISVHISMCF